LVKLAADFEFAFHGAEAVGEVIFVRVDGDGESPAWVGESGPVEDGERGAEADGVRAVGVGEQGLEIIEGEFGEIAELIFE
jgi:hypothetical protein